MLLLRQRRMTLAPLPAGGLLRLASIWSKGIKRSVFSLCTFTQTSRAGATAMWRGLSTLGILPEGVHGARRATRAGTEDELLRPGSGDHMVADMIPARELRCSPGEAGAGGPARLPKERPSTGGTVEGRRGSPGKVLPADIFTWMVGPCVRRYRAWRASGITSLVCSWISYQCFWYSSVPIILTT